MRLNYLLQARIGGLRAKQSSKADERKERSAKCYQAGLLVPVWGIAIISQNGQLLQRGSVPNCFDNFANGVDDQFGLIDDHHVGAVPGDH
jgi:hypothetical protein